MPAKLSRPPLKGLEDEGMRESITTIFKLKRKEGKGRSYFIRIEAYIALAYMAALHAHALVWTPPPVIFPVRSQFILYLTRWYSVFDQESSRQSWPESDPEPCLERSAISLILQKGPLDSGYWILDLRKLR